MFSINITVKCILVYVKICEEIHEEDLSGDIKDHYNVRGKEVLGKGKLYQLIYNNIYNYTPCLFLCVQF